MFLMDFVKTDDNHLIRPNMYNKCKFEMYSKCKFANYLQYCSASVSLQCRANVVGV